MTTLMPASLPSKKPPATNGNHDRTNKKNENKSCDNFDVLVDVDDSDDSRSVYFNL